MKAPFAFFMVGLSLAAGVGAPARAQSDQVGQWGSPFSLQIVAVHLHVLPTGKVMYYSYGDDPRIYDPQNGSITLIPQAGFNIFCTGHSFMADGRLHVTGGHVQNGWGLPDASIYDPFANSWTRLPDMQNGRWYPTNLTLPSGEVLVVSGSFDVNFSNNTLPQVWTGSAWRNLTGAQMGLDLYPDLHGAPNGQVFLSGPGQATRYLNTSGSGAWTLVANRQFPNRDYGSAVHYDDGKVIHIGGGDPSTATAEVIDLNAPTPSWRYTANSMSINRRQMNATLLPDGKVLVTGGVSGPGFNDMSTPVYSVELWDPATDRFTTMAGMAVGRWYHSTAALLPDGRVLSAGGDNNPNAEIYSPPYLFRGSRPSITSAPSSVGYGQTFFVGTPDGAGIASVNWVRLTSVTHATNMDQRMNRLGFSQASGGLNVTAPSSSFLCPPGPYMLFLLYSNGVPSPASIVRISTAGGSVPAAPTGLSAAAVSATQVNLAWSDNATNEDGYKIERSTDGVSFSQVATAAINATSHQDTGLSASTTYHYRVRAYNAHGDSAYSSVASATTPGVATSAVAAYSFDEAAGSTAGDASGNGNTGAISGAVWTAGRYGNALQFNGTGALVTVSDSVSLDLTSGMTLEAWVYRTSTAAEWKDVIYKGQDDIYYLEGCSPQGGAPAMGGTFSASPLYGTAAAPLNAWTHLAATYDGATMRLYVNGAQVASRAQTGPIQTSTGSLTIGGDPLYGQYWGGRIDEVRIYNRALSPSEIQTDMDTPIGNAAPPPPDTQPPTAPDNLAATAASGSQINLSWTASDDNRGVSGYLVERCQGGGCTAFSQIGTTTGATYSDTGLAMLTSYSYRVRARDTSGNLSSYSSVASATTLATVPGLGSPVR